MDTNMTWTPYLEKITEQLGSLTDHELSEYDGRSLPALPPPSELKAFKSEKAAKICVGSFRVDNSLQIGLCTIFPEKGLDLPLFISYWQESEKEVSFMVDLMPPVDTFVDEPYREKYLEPLGPLWEKFAALPGICPEEDDALRSVCSINYTAARVPIKNPGLRAAALAPHTAYLKKYCEHLQAARPIENSAKLREIERKTASVRGLLQVRFREKLAPALGNENPDSVVGIFF